MRQQTRTFVQNFLEKHNVYDRVLDVGALDVNGTIKDLFRAGTYTGSDMREGKCVDVVVNGHNLTDVFEPESFDIVCCFDTFEHDDAFWLTWEQMKTVCKPGGWLLFGAPGPACPEHAHPQDYWRFMPQSFHDYFLKDLSDTFLEAQKDNPHNEFHDEVYGYGRKA